MWSTCILAQSAGLAPQHLHLAPSRLRTCIRSFLHSYEARNASVATKAERGRFCFMRFLTGLFSPLTHAKLFERMRLASDFVVTGKPTAWANRIQPPPLSPPIT